MKKTLKIISLLMAVILLTLTLGSCSAIRFAIMTDPARAIYLYEMSEISLNEGYNLVTENTIEQTIGQEKDTMTSLIESSLSDIGTESMTYVEKTYNVVDGKRENESILGFSDGKLFVSVEDNKILSTLGADDFVDFMNDLSANNDTYFNMSILNCDSAEYSETDDGGYKVALSDFFGEAEDCVANMAASMLGVNKSLITFKSYSITTEIDSDYFPINETKVIEVDADFGTGGIANFKITMESSYTRADGETSAQIPDLSEFRVLADLRPVLLASSLYSDRSLEPSGNFTLQRRTQSHTANSESVEQSFKYDVEYGNTENGFEYSIQGTYDSGSYIMTNNEIYSKGKLSVTIEVDNDEYEDEYSEEFISESAARANFVYYYLSSWRLELGLVETVEILDEEDGVQEIIINADVNDERIKQRFYLGEEDEYKVDNYQYVFAFGDDGTLLSCSMRGSSSGIGYSCSSEWTVAFWSEK